MEGFDFGDLDPRFGAKSNRIFGGRTDEAVYHYVTGIVPTQYTFIKSADNLLWRYVSLAAHIY